MPRDLVMSVLTVLLVVAMTLVVKATMLWYRVWTSARTAPASRRSVQGLRLLVFLTAAAHAVLGFFMVEWQQHHDAILFGGWLPAIAVVGMVYLGVHCDPGKYVRCRPVAASSVDRGSGSTSGSRDHYGEPIAVKPAAATARRPFIYVASNDEEDEEEDSSSCSRRKSAYDDSSHENTYSRQERERARYEESSERYAAARQADYERVRANEREAREARDTQNRINSFYGNCG